jgi:hypothetical protein
MTHVSDIDDSCGISTHHIFLSKCAMQVMRVWSLPAVLSLLAKLHIRYGVTQPTAYRISHGIYGGPGIMMKTPCSYSWMPCQLRRSLVAFGIDLPVMSVHGMSVHGAGAYAATASPACSRTQHHTFYGCTCLGSAAYPLLNKLDPAPAPGVPVPFGSAQPSQGCVCDTDQLVELPLIDITDASSMKTAT